MLIEGKGYRKSTRSQTFNCVEVELNSGVVNVRNSKRPDGARVQFNQDEWSAFVAGAKAGEFDIAG